MATTSPTSVERSVCYRNTIIRLRQRFQQTGGVADRRRPGRPRVTKPRTDRFITLTHLRRRFQTATSSPRKYGISKQNNEICFPSTHNATPYHNTPTSKSVHLNETVISKAFSSSSKNSNSTVMTPKVMIIRLRQRFKQTGGVADRR